MAIDRAIETSAITAHAGQALFRESAPQLLTV
jgi:hypothetical protein